MGRAGVLLSALAALAFPATGAADRIGRLRASNASLAATERAAVLQLFAIDTRLDRARGDLERVASRLAAARRRESEARQLLEAARRSLRVARLRLGGQLRALYEGGQVDALAVILGSTSLDDVITSLDGLSRAVRSSGVVVDQVDRARRRTIRLVRTLDRRTALLSRLEASAQARAAELASARSERVAYVAGLRSRQRLNARRIAALERQARAAEAAATVATVKAQAVRILAPVATAAPAADASSHLARAASPPKPAHLPAAATPPAAPTPVQPAAGSRSRLTVIATAYSLPGHTASGLPVGPGVVAVDPTVIPLGTRLYIPGYGEGIAADTGTAIKGLRIDLWFPTLRQAQQWGARTVTITVD